MIALHFVFDFAGVLTGNQAALLALRFIDFLSLESCVLGSWSNMLGRQLFDQRGAFLFYTMWLMYCRFNQATVSYDASKEEKLETLKKRQEAVEERLREKGKRE